ncbi:hypothetical protein SERLA73DRAFT_157129 [Serpula lacrymans var. lacrymans S7.3]|uniref:Uncharacterized protein n=1 Tax=Serpula lacrymans var. lacrymans (strain S7.3) TaxID=936435 RepID=F8QHK0_SERL3|nr:hypothetical protein SERLA73DRAFT_157129 [Serpula lacrymans var. lacrymans S7.3]
MPATKQSAAATTPPPPPVSPKKARTLWDTSDPLTDISTETEPSDLSRTLSSPGVDSLQGNAMDISSHDKVMKSGVILMEGCFKSLKDTLIEHICNNQELFTLAHTGTHYKEDDGERLPLRLHEKHKKDWSYYLCDPSTNTPFTFWIVGCLSKIWLFEWGPDGAPHP